MATYSHARCAGKASVSALPFPSPCPTIRDAIRIPAMIASIAQNSVVLKACFVSVARRATTPDLCADDARLVRTASVAMPDPFRYVRVPPVGPRLRLPRHIAHKHQGRKLQARGHADAVPVLRSGAP